MEEKECKGYMLSVTERKGKEHLQVVDEMYAKNTCQGKTFVKEEKEECIRISVELVEGE